MFGATLKVLNFPDIQFRDLKKIFCVNLIFQFRDFIVFRRYLISQFWKKKEINKNTEVWKFLE